MILDNRSARLPFKMDARGYIMEKLSVNYGCELVTYIIAAIGILVI